MPTRRGDRSSKALPRSPLFLATAVFLVTWGLAGGARLSGVAAPVALGLAGSLLAAVVAATGAWRRWADLAPAARLLVAFTVLMPLVQLAPLPPGWWQALPGRALPATVLDEAGLAAAWHPLTLTLIPTAITALLFVWLLALLLACLSLSTDELRRLFALVFVLGLVNVAVGAVQVASGGRAGHIYDSLQAGMLLGLFANKNHTGLFIALSLLAGYAARYAGGWRRADLPLAAAAVLLVMGALVATFSRAGLVLGLLALAVTVWLSAGGRLRRAAAWGVGGATALLALGGVALTGSVVAGRSFDRFAGVGQDLRWSIWPWSWPLVERYFPLGSGIGSFDPVFRAGERLDWVKPTYVNNAHNDYLEQLIEIGIGAPLLWLLIALALAGPVRAAMGMRTRQSGRLALIGAAMLMLVALHSLVDYPLRRPALAAVAVLALAAVLRIDRVRREKA